MTIAVTLRRCGGNCRLATLRRRLRQPGHVMAMSLPADCRAQATAA